MSQEQDRARREVRYSNAKEWAEHQERGFEPSAVKIPSGFKMFQTKKQGIYRVQVIPYFVGWGNPQADEGMVHYERTYYGHAIPGLDGKAKVYCCLAACFKRPCPVCDFVRAESRNPQANQKFLEDLRKPKVRQLWIFDDMNIQGQDSIQIYESAYFMSFGELLKNKIQAVARYEDFFKLTHKEGGMTLQLSVAPKTYQGRTFNQITNIEMLPRERDYDVSILDKVPCLDDCIIPARPDAIKDILPNKMDERDWQDCYNVLRRILLQEPEKKRETTTSAPSREEPRPSPREEPARETRGRDEEAPRRREEEPPPRRSRDDDDDPRRPRDEPARETPRETARDDRRRDEPVPERKREEDPPRRREEPPPVRTDDPTAQQLGHAVNDKVFHEKFGACDIIKISGDGTSITIEDEDGREHRAIAPRELRKIAKESPPKEKERETRRDEDGPRRPAAREDDGPRRRDDEPAPRRRDDDDDGPRRRRD